MTPDLLRLAGEALYGPRWQTALAGDLGVTDRTMRRWAGGQPMPPGAAADLAALLRARKIDIDVALAHLAEPSVTTLPRPHEPSPR